MCSLIPFGLIDLAAQSGFHFPFLFIFPTPAHQRTGPIGFRPVPSPLPYSLPPSVITAVPPLVCVTTAGRSAPRHPIWLTLPRPLLSWNRHPTVSPPLGADSKLEYASTLKPTSHCRLPSSTASASCHSPIKASQEHPLPPPLPNSHPFLHLRTLSSSPSRTSGHSRLLLVAGPNHAAPPPFDAAVMIPQAPSSFSPTAVEPPWPEPIGSVSFDEPSHQHWPESIVDSWISIVAVVHRTVSSAHKVFY
jgi:hypothetical protein